MKTDDLIDENELSEAVLNVLEYRQKLTDAHGKVQHAKSVMEEIDDLLEDAKNKLKSTMKDETTVNVRVNARYYTITQDRNGAYITDLTMHAETDT